MAEILGIAMEPVVGIMFVVMAGHVQRPLHLPATFVHVLRITMVTCVKNQ